MRRLEDDLNQDLAALDAQGLRRRLWEIDSAQGRLVQVAGRNFLNFSSNDYLGFATDPSLKEAAVRAVERFGTGSGASRLISGSLAPHHQLEEALASFKQTEAALSFSSGYAAALGTICALAGKGDIIAIDRLVHASIVDAARLSGAKLRVFAHNDVEDLARILQWADALDHASPSRGPRQRRLLIVTESVFSMDGDLAPLREIVQLKERHGACLMVDEAHATGVLGPFGRGVADALGVSEGVDVQMGTLGKALGSAGGYICGSRTLIDFLVNRARSFIFSTAPVPAAAAAAQHAILLVKGPQGDRAREMLRARLAGFRDGLRSKRSALGLADGLPVETPASAIVPLHVGLERDAVALADRLRELGLFVPAIRYPTVARGRARLRLTFTATHTADDVQQLLAALPALP